MEELTDKYQEREREEKEQKPHRIGDKITGLFGGTPTGTNSQISLIVVRIFSLLLIL